MVDPICKFIADEVEAYHDGYSEHLVPIVICKREGCGKFVMPRRIGRKSLCDDCKDKHFNEVRRPLQTERRWLYRLIEIGDKRKGGSKGALIKLLADPKIKERFSRAKKLLPKLAAKVSALVS
jgi:hypothetical protein